MHDDDRTKKKINTIKCQLHYNAFLLPLCVCVPPHLPHFIKKINQRTTTTMPIMVATAENFFNFSTKFY